MTMDCVTALDMTFKISRLVGCRSDISLAM